MEIRWEFLMEHESQALANKWLIGNWKLHGSLAFDQEIIAGLRTLLPNLDSRVGLALSPVFPYLLHLGELVKETGIKLSGQDISDQTTGAYTGQVSGRVLKDVGASFVIIGHSERRYYQGEDDALIARKARAALDAGLIPVLCVGETADERDAGLTEQVLQRQLNAVLDLLDLEKETLFIAYEPRWAIGTGVSASPETIAAVHHFLRSCLVRKSPEAGRKIRILYGGSMNAGNANLIAEIKDVDGGLIGSAALKPEEFASIYQAVLASVD
jgi:triosephosphate isomerase